MASTVSRVATARIPNAVADELERAAAQHKTTRSALIAQLVARGLPTLR